MPFILQTSGLSKRSVVRHLSLILIFIFPKGEIYGFLGLTELVKPQ